MAEDGGRVRVCVPDFDPALVSLETEANHQAYEKTWLKVIRGYAEASECSRRYVANDLGQEIGSEYLGMCDIDAVGLADPAEWLKADEP